MPCIGRSIVIAAPADRGFAYVDDIRNLARHMSEERSMAMMGSRLTLEIMTPEATGICATYRYFGREPRLLIVRGYEMALSVDPVSAASSRLTIAFDYELPRSGPWRLVGRMFAPWYGRWCLDSMTRGAKRDVERL